MLRSAGRSAVFPRTGSAAFYASLDPNKIRGYLDLDAAKLFFTSKYLITLNNVVGALSENIADSKALSFDQQNRDELYTSVKFRTQELVFLTELEIAYQQGNLTANDYSVLHDCNAEAYELPIRANQYEGPDCAEKVRSVVDKLPSRVTAAMRQFAVAD